jgi:aryl-alcohol dehydrogenase-like predicted oxidoreductase
LAFLQDLEGGISVSALRFQLSNPYSTVTIPGIKNTKQANDAIMAMRLGPLSTDVINNITEAVPEVFYKWR